jgi:5'-methylthioadenosine phosphorylase
MQDRSTDRIVSLVLDLHRFLRKRMCDIPHGKDDLNMHQLQSLMLIRERAGITMKELADMLRISRPSATSFVNRLVRHGLVARMADAANRKLVRLKLTPKAARMVDHKLRERNDSLADIFGRIPAADRASFVRIIDNLLHSLSSSPADSR